MELIAPDRWLGVRTRGNGRFWSEISHTYIDEDGNAIPEHEKYAYFETPFDAALVRDLAVLDKNIPNETLNFPYLDEHRLRQLANQAKERQLRANERMTLGTGTGTQTIADLVETFAEESDSNIPLLERKLVDIPIPSNIRSQQNFSGSYNQYRYFIWEQDKEWFLDKYEQDDENVWIRRWAEPLVFDSEAQALVQMQVEMEQDNGDTDNSEGSLFG